MWQLRRILLQKVIQKFRNYYVIVNQNMAPHIQGVNGINNELKGTAVMKTKIFYFIIAIYIDF